MTMTAEEIAQVCHAANRALQQIQGDPTIPVSPKWEKLDEETRQSVIQGVENVLRGATPRQSHENWMQFKFDHGWRLGLVKDETKKEHPLLVPYDELPESQKLKDALFIAVVVTCAQQHKDVSVVNQDKTNAAFREGFGDGQ